MLPGDYHDQWITRPDPYCTLRKLCASGTGLHRHQPAEVPAGAPYTYVTARSCLSHFGLDTLRQLPDIEALEEIGHAFAAVTACVIMLAAQWTPSLGLGSRSELNTFFRFVEMPSWVPGESYTQSQPSAETLWTQILSPELAS